MVVLLCVITILLDQVHSVQDGAKALDLMSIELLFGLLQGLFRSLPSTGDEDDAVDHWAHGKGVRNRQDRGSVEEDVIENLSEAYNEVIHFLRGEKSNRRRRNGFAGNKVEIWDVSMPHEVLYCFWNQ